MANGVIGKLTLDVSDVEKKVDKINQALSKIGTNSQVKIQIADEVKKQLDKVYDEIQKGAEKLTKAMQNIGGAKTANAENKELNEALRMYEKLYNAKAKMYELEQKGQQVSTAYAKASDDVKKYQAALDDLGRKITDNARNTERYNAILDRYVAVTNAAKNAADRRAAQDEAREAEEATKAYLKLLEAKSKVKQLEYEGKQDTLEYTKATQAAGQAYDAFIRYSQGAREAARASREAAQARKDLNAVEGKTAEKATETEYLNQAKAAYDQLTIAMKNYLAYRKEKNQTGMDQSKSEIDNLMTQVNLIAESVKNSQLDEASKARVLDYIERIRAAYHDYSAEMTAGHALQADMESQISGLMMRWFSLMAVIRTVTSLIRNSVEYVSEFSNKMNEIQIITQKSDDDVAKLAQTYKQIAKDMNVSTLDMADAAIYFTRQGLAAEEIEERLKNVTMYAKTANVEFKDASEIITAVVNSMNLVEQSMDDGRNATQRVADVFLAVGDSAATSGEEIGQAMQKAAASAGAFGMSFEWLASYIATVSETTRQEARTIGTAFNTIIARLHQIKQKGYNEEDETKINDVAKALAKIDVALMDNNNEWRDMDTIFQEIGEKWGTLDGKTKSYIATTMAGVKQQNVFLALMNDLGKGIEGNSRAWELYQIAMDSAGIASEKYSIYLDSVAASQERLTLAQEDFYSALLSDQTIIQFNDIFAGFIDLVSRGTESMGKMNFILPAIAGGITLVAHAVNNMAKMWDNHPVLLIISGVVAAVTALSTIAGAIDKAAEASKRSFEEANESIQDHTTKLKSLKNIQSDTEKSFAKLGSSTQISAKDLAEHNSLLEKLCEVSPNAKRIVGELQEGLISEATAVQQLNEELEKQIELEKQLTLSEGIKKYSNYQNPDNIQNLLYMMNQSFVDINKEGGFSEWLSVAYDAYQDAYTMTDDLYNNVKQKLNSLKNTNMSPQEKWGLIGNLVWAELFGTYDMSMNPMDLMRSQVEQEIENTIQLLGEDLSGFDKISIKQYLTDMLFGGDNELSVIEYASFAERITQFLADFASKGMSMVHLEPSEVLNNIGTDMFGNYFDIMFDPEELEKIGNDPKIVSAIATAYTTLLEAGFNSQQLANFYRNLDLSQWDQAIEYMKDEIRARIAEAAQSELGELTEDLDTGKTTLDPLMWASLDVATLKTIEDMVNFGVSLDDVKQAMKDASTVDEFKQKLKSLGEEAEYVPDGMDEATDAIEAFAEKTKDAFKEIDKITGLINAMKDEKPFSLDDIMELATSDSDMLKNINSIEGMVDALQKIKDSKMSEVIGTLKQSLMDSVKFAAAAPFETGGKSLADYIKGLSDDSAKEVTHYVDKITTLMIAQSDRLSDVGKDMLGTMITSMFSDANMDLLNRKIVDMGDEWATMLSMTVDAGPDGDHEFEWSQNIVMNLTPITPDGEILDDDTLRAYIQELFDKSANLEELFANDKLENGGKGLLVNAHVGFDKDAFAEMISQAETEAQVLHLLHQAYYQVTQAEETWLQKKVRSHEEEVALVKAKENLYKDQINAMLEVYNTDAAKEGLSSKWFSQDIFDQWDTYFDALKDGIADTYPDVASALREIEAIMNNTTMTAEEQEAALVKLLPTLKQALDLAKDYTPETTLKDRMSEIDDITKDIDNIQKVLDKINNQETIDGTDLIDLTNAHPELINYINDIDTLKAKLQELKDQQKKIKEEETRDMIWDSKEWMSAAPFQIKFAAQNGGFENLRDYAMSLDKSSEAYKHVVEWVHQAVQNLMDAEEGFDGATETWLETQVKEREAAAELKKAQDENFKSQISELTGALGSKGGAGAAYNVWAEYGEDMRKAFGDAYPEINKAMLAVEDAINSEGDLEEASGSLGKALAIAFASIPSDQLQKDIDKIKEAKEEIDKLDNAIKQLGEGKKLSFADMIDIASAHPEVMSMINDIDALKAKLEELRSGDSSEALKNAFKDMLMNSPEYMQASVFSQFYDPNNEKGNGAINNLKELEEQMPQTKSQVEQAVDGIVNKLEDGYDKAKEVAEDFLAKQVETAQADAELNWAKTNDFVEQIGELNEALGEGGTEGVEKAQEVWNAYNKDMQKSLMDTYPSIGEAMLELRNIMDDTNHTEEQVAAASEKLNRELTKAGKSANSKYWKDTYQAMQQLEKGTISVDKAYDTFNKQVDKYKKASQDIVNYNQKISEKSEVTESDVKNLADALGIPAEKILADWPGAMELFEDMKREGEEVYAALNKEATMKILGIGEADFGNLMSGMVAVQDTASATVQMLMSLGSFTLESREVQEGVDFPIINADGSYTMHHATTSGKYQFLVPTSNNAFASGSSKGGSGSKGGGGGGGGGGGKKKTETTKMLERMSNVKDAQDWQQSYYQSQQKYYEGTGQLQGVIEYMKLERDAIEEQNKTLADNVRIIEENLAAKKAELATLKEGSKKYDEVADDVNKLQKAQQDYTKQLVDNKTAMNDLTKAIKEQQDKIRDMEIDLRNTIYSAIEDREKKRVDMLSAEIELQNIILDLIKARYEKERDEIIDTTNKRIEALQKERDLLGEQLELRKKMADQEEKATKLANLEKQYQHISADPTRAKEALKIRKQITELRDEMAWEAAEEEVKAQQDSIDQQIESLEDYIEYMNNYYEDLFEHPKQLIEETRQIMMQTDEEIIEWLKNNNDEYKNATAQTQQQMVKSWQGTLDTMHGEIITYWAEVENIITQGDDAIIEFLKENSADYAAAGKLQAEKYVDEWKKKIEDLKKALEEVAATAQSTSSAIDSSTSGGGGGGGGGGGTVKYGYKFEDSNYKPSKKYDSGKTYSTTNDALTAGTTKRNAIIAGYRDKNEYAKIGNVGSVSTYLKGGLASKTGLAWLDGTQENPERVLSPYQTRLFETMIQALEKMSRVSVPTMPNFESLNFDGAGGVSVGDIIVNVDNLDTDDDYEKLAKKVSEILMERIGRTAVVGGIRIN